MFHESVRPVNSMHVTAKEYTDIPRSNHQCHNLKSGDKKEIVLCKACHVMTEGKSAFLGNVIH